MSALWQFNSIKWLMFVCCTAAAAAARQFSEEVELYEQPPHSASLKLWAFYPNHFVIFVYRYNTHTHTHTQPFNGTTRVGRYQKNHSPTHTHPDHWTSFINFLHLQRSMASSLFSFRAWQSSLTTSLQVLFGLPLGLGPSTSYSMHFFTQSSSSRSTCPYQRRLPVIINDTSLLVSSGTNCLKLLQPILILASTAASASPSTLSMSPR